MAHADDYYTILGVAKNATPAEINKAFRALALQYHPDKNLERKDSAERMFKLISEAHSVLSNDGARQRYDVELSRGSLRRSASGILRAYCYLIPAYRPSTTAPQDSRCFIREGGCGQYSSTDMGGYHGYAYSYAPQYAYAAGGPWSTREAMSRTASMYFNHPSYYGGTQTPSQCIVSPSAPHHQGAQTVASDYERQTSTRIVQGKRVDLEVIKENNTETVNMYEDGILTHSTFRRLAT